MVSEAFKHLSQNVECTIHIRMHTRQASGFLVVDERIPFFVLQTPAQRSWLGLGCAGLRRQRLRGSLNILPLLNFKWVVSWRVSGKEQYEQCIA
ncbi:hypothetical protein, partial [Cupriavidus sp.]|uniref:hypothetical protein n=1 Tax=Cupriavidus sp. TaxID=1873897 RepID=UPI003D0C69DF